MRLKLLGLACVCAIAACTNKPKEVIEQNLTVSVNSSVTTWVAKCNNGSYECTEQELSNARTMSMGNDLYYICDLNNDLYMYKATHRGFTNMTKVLGAKCEYSIKLYKP